MLKILLKTELILVCLRAVRFEDIAMNVSGYSNRLLKYINVDDTPFYNNYVKDHTQPKRSNAAVSNVLIKPRTY